MNCPWMKIQHEATIDALCESLGLNAIDIVFMSNHLSIHETPSTEGIRCSKLRLPTNIDTGQISPLKGINGPITKCFIFIAQTRNLWLSIGRNFNDPSCKRELSNPSNILCRLSFFRLNSSLLKFPKHAIRLGLNKWVAEILLRFLQ